MTLKTMNNYRIAQKGAPAPEEEEDAPACLVATKDEWAPDTLAGFGPETRTILIAGEIDGIMGSAVCSQIEWLAKEENAPIKIMINSPGGDVIQTLAIYDTLRAVPCPIITVAQGMAFSGGFLLMQAGDLRVAFPHSRLFYHEPLSEFQVANTDELGSQSQCYSWSLDSMNAIIRKRTKMNNTNWKKYFTGKTSMYFTAAEAKQLNVIDEIVEYQKKLKLILGGNI